MPLEFASPILQDYQTIRTGQFDPVTSRTFEQILRFELKEWSSLAGQLIEKKIIPPTLTKLLPVLPGAPDIVAGGASQIRRGKWTPSVDELTKYLDGLNKIAWATLGAALGGSWGASIGGTGGALAADMYRDASEPLFRQLANSPVQKNAIENWRAHVDAAVAHGVPAKTLSEMYTMQVLKEMGFNTKTIAGYDIYAILVNDSVREIAKDKSKNFEWIQKPIPASTIHVPKADYLLSQDDPKVFPINRQWWLWRRFDDPPPIGGSGGNQPPPPLPIGSGPPPPPPGGGSVTQPGNLQTRRPNDIETGNYNHYKTVVSGREPGGAILAAEVVKNKPPDTSDLLGSRTNKNSIVATNQNGLYSPFLLFCSFTGK